MKAVFFSISILSMLFFFRGKGGEEKREKNNINRIAVSRGSSRKGKRNREMKNECKEEKLRDGYK